MGKTRWAPHAFLFQLRIVRDSKRRSQALLYAGEWTPKADEIGLVLHLDADRAGRDGHGGPCAGPTRGEAGPRSVPDFQPARASRGFGYSFPVSASNFPGVRAISRVRTLRARSRHQPNRPSGAGGRSFSSQAPLLAPISAAKIVARLSLFGDHMFLGELRSCVGDLTPPVYSRAGSPRE